uniref:Uncharacterized protein n=1 Tax=uncultured marine virus TaxID=186617 RepID=A0A0F7L0A1_9VIRU|nr:hypothetical protein [uncultured marine virus]
MRSFPPSHLARSPGAGWSLVVLERKSMERPSMSVTARISKPSGPRAMLARAFFGMPLVVPLHATAMASRTDDLPTPLGPTNKVIGSMNS